MCGYFSPTQSNGDRFAILLPFPALSAVMTAPPAGIERDAPARCGIFAGPFAGLFVRHLSGQRGHVFFASADVASSFRPTMDRLRFLSCA